MTTTTHTPTRLTHRETGDANSYVLLDDTGNWFMSARFNGEQMTARQEANLRRLAACWNKFDGMPTDSIEAMPGTVSDLAECFDSADDAALAGRRLIAAIEDAALDATKWEELRESILTRAAAPSTH